LLNVEVRSVKEIQNAPLLHRPRRAFVDDTAATACPHYSRWGLGTTLTIGRNRALKQVTVVIRYPVPVLGNKARIAIFARS
jgi:hypothetical protein